METGKETDGQVDIKWALALKFELAQSGLTRTGMLFLGLFVS